MRPKIVIAYDATTAAADGLALGALLADLRGAEIVVARVLPHSRSDEATERALQASFRATIQETRETAAETLDERPFEVWPVFGESVAAGLDDLASDRGAELIVFGSPHHGVVGRALLGDTALAAAVGAPCALAVAPRGFRERGTLDPPVVGVAFDSSAESRAAVDTGVALARAAGATLRLITVEPSGWSRPIRHHEPVAPALALLAAELEDGLEVETRLLDGDPVHTLQRETDNLGLLVCGSRAHGPLSRVMVGSVSSAVIHLAACPVVVVPRRAAKPLQAAAVAALSRN
jgi:nucleotide-binding universal stress UspA family protein